MGLNGAKGVSTPCNPREDAEEDCEPLRPQEATMYRALAAKCNYISADRCDITFAVKEICKRMSIPSHGDWERIKRLARYLIQYPRLETVFPFEDLPKVIQAYSDSDWAGDRETRRSTTAGALIFGRAAIKVITKQQQILAKSSAEAELYAVNTMAGEALSMRSILKDMNINVGIVLHVDAKATIGILHRHGLGKMKHLQVQHLWLQEGIRNGNFKILKIPTKDNLADIGTKPLAGERIQYLVRKLNMSCGGP